MDFVINLKTYKFGKNALKIAKQIEEINKNIIIGVQATDIYLISKNTNLKVYAQHVDAISPGRNTGFITPEAVKASGARGVFLNHSEHKINFSTLKKTIMKCKKLNLKTLIFVPSVQSAKKIEKLNPDFLIYEPPKLVASSKSVSDLKPHMISKISKSIKMPFLVGAGIKNKKDVKKSIELGASGVALSSAITKSKNPKKVLKNLGI